MSVAGTHPIREPSPFRMRHVLALVIACVGLIGALLLGGWGLGTARGSHDDPRDGGWVQVQSGWVRVDEVVDRSLKHRRMSSMQTMPDADPVPTGHVRYLVQLSVAAEGEPIRWRPGDIRVSGSGMSPAPAHAVRLGDGVVPAGTTVSGSVTLDVPEGARKLTLAFGDAHIPLPRGRVDTASDDSGHTDGPAGH